MLFVTNRTPKESSQSTLNRDISFSLQNTNASQDVYFCQRQGKNKYTEVGNDDFFQQLKDLPNKTQVLLYIHGFNNTGEAEVFPNAAKLQKLFNKHGGEDLVYVVPIIWPCDDDSFIAFMDDYWDDQRAADASGIAFSRLLGKFNNWRKAEAAKPDPCTRRINILAHSMGNRVLRNTLASWAKYESPQIPLLFRNIFMVAADVVNHTLEKGNKGELITHAARNVVVYYANDDLAMPASKLINLKNRTVSRRLGMTGPEQLEKVARNVYEVDCDNFNNTFDKPKGHSYFLTGPKSKVSPALLHMIEAIKTGRVNPNERHHEL
jgi:esterase/lipase superfamily enzyme